MTQEEKASAYDVLLTKAKQIYNKENDVLIIHTIEDLFPTIKENEDERVRKAIISGMKALQEKGKYTEFAHIPMDEVFTWLEKQSNTNKEYWRGYREGKQEILDKYAKLEEQGKLKETLCEKCKKAQPSHSCQDITALGRCAVEHEQKVEPKFHEGEWITNGDYTWKIVEVKPLYYILQSQDGNIVDDTISHVDEQFHSFTIQDAKEGDVLYAKGFYGDCVFIFNGLDKWKFDEPSGDRAVATGHCCITISSKNIEFGTQGPDCVEVDTVNPATKEQRDLLFKKMKESGYDFDFETKELKKIDTYCQENCKGFQETGRCFCDGDCKAKKEYIEQNLQENNFPQIEQKPAWSKEDDYNVQCLIAKVTYDIQKGNVGRNQELIDWLKSLKYRMNND